MCIDKIEMYYLVHMICSFTPASIFTLRCKVSNKLCDLFLIVYIASIPQEEPSPGQRGTLNHPPVVMRTTALPVPTWSYCEAEMGEMVMMEYQDSQAEMERMDHLAPEDQLDPLAPLASLLLILVCRVPLGQRDPLALLGPQEQRDPLDLRDQPLALVGLFMCAGDEPPVLAHLEQSWCTQE